MEKSYPQRVLDYFNSKKVIFSAKLRNFDFDQIVGQSGDSCAPTQVYNLLVLNGLGADLGDKKVAVKNLINEVGQHHPFYNAVMKGTKTPQQPEGNPNKEGMATKHVADVYSNEHDMHGKVFCISDDYARMAADLFARDIPFIACGPERESGHCYVALGRNEEDPKGEHFLAIDGDKTAVRLGLTYKKSQPYFEKAHNGLLWIEAETTAQPDDLLYNTYDEILGGLPANKMTKYGLSHLMANMAMVDKRNYKKRRSGHLRSQHKHHTPRRQHKRARKSSMPQRRSSRKRKGT
jgi:hypothetical protein